MLGTFPKNKTPFSSATTQHRGHLDRRVVRKDDNTEALVYSTDFTNTYPITTPALCILEEKILLLAAVY